MENQRQFHMIPVNSKKEVSDEEVVPVPINYNFEKIMKSENGDFIARHLLGENFQGADVVSELMLEHELYEPLLYLAWLWAHGFVVETFPGFYNVDLRVPFDFDNYEGYTEGGGISLKETMIDYDLYGLKDVLIDPTQVL